MKIAITGANGRVGKALVTALEQAGHQTIALTRHSLDLSSGEDHIKAALHQVEFDCLLNPAALSAPDQCETQIDLCYQINAAAPRSMAEFCAAQQRRFIHFSTDYVFSGEEQGKRQEDDLCAPINHYGRAKREGELAVLSHDPRALVLRVSWIYGGEKPGFVDQVIAQLQAQRSIHAVADKWSIPTLLPDLCDWVQYLCEHPQGGIFHACHGGEPVSWHGLAVATQQALLRQGKLSHTEAIHAQQLADIPAFIATRPVHSAMDSSRLSSLLPTPIQPWQDRLDQWIAASP